MAQNPQAGKFSQSVTVQWTDGTNFNGFLLAGIVPPSNGVTAWTSVAMGDNYPAARLPVWARIPIVDGKYNASCALFYNDDMTPPGSEYVAYYYDATGRQIAGPTAQFTVSTDPFTPPSATLTAPSTTGTAPTPN